MQNLDDLYEKAASIMLRRRKDMVEDELPGRMDKNYFVELSVVMNLDLPWNPAKLEQRIARAWRKRQTRDVLVVNLVAENTQKPVPTEDPLTPETLAMLAKLAKLGLVTLGEEAKRRLMAVESAAKESQEESVEEQRAKAAEKHHLPNGNISNTTYPMMVAKHGDSQALTRSMPC